MPDFSDFLGLRGAGLMVSPLDQELVAEWERRGLPVAVVCRTGQTSSDAAKRLHKAGFTRVYWLNDGLNAWIQADLPLTKGR